MSIRGVDIKSIAEGVLFTLDLDYVVFDVVEGPEPSGWRLTFFDGTRARGRSILDISVVPTATASEDVLADEIKRELTRHLGCPPSRRGFAQGG